jgi:hypothetical protein
MARSIVPVASGARRALRNDHMQRARTRVATGAWREQERAPEVT